MLRASLAPISVVVVDAGHTPPADTETLLEVFDLGDEVRLVVRDEVQRKTTERNVALAGIPRGARALTVASAADGLLRVAWLAGADHPDAAADVSSTPPPTPHAPPAQAPRAGDVEPPRDAPPAHAGSRRAGVRLGARAAMEVASAGTTQLGGDAVVEVSFGSIVAGVHGGVRDVVARSFPEGTVDGRALAGGISIELLATPPRAPLGLSFGPGVDVFAMHFAGVATPTAGAPERSRSGDGVAVVAALSTTASWQATSLVRLVLVGRGGYAVHAVHALVSDEAVTGLGGAVLGVAAGVLLTP